VKIKSVRTRAFEWQGKVLPGLGVEPSRHQPGGFDLIDRYGLRLDRSTWCYSADQTGMVNRR
jgi:hypothetical protein